MPDLKLKPKLVIGSFVIALLMTVATIIATTIIVAQQNRAISKALLDHSVRILKKDVTASSAELLSNARQMATINDMGTRIQFIIEEKSGTDHTLARDFYIEAAKDLYRIATANDIYRAAIYDRDNELVAFVQILSGEAHIGFNDPALLSKLQAATIKTGDNPDALEWKKNHENKAFPLKLGIDPKQMQTTGFEVVDDGIGITACSPVTSQTFNAETEAFEKQQIGFVKAVRKLDTSFLARIAELSRTEVNLFTREGFNAGTLPTQSTLLFDTADVRTKAVEFQNQAPLYKDVDIQDEGYFQVILPVYADRQCIGAFAGLYSRNTSKQHTLEMIRLLLVIAFFCLLLILPLTFVFSKSITDPVSKVVSGLRDVARGKGDLTHRLPVNSKDELGELAQWFNVFIDHLQTTIRNISENAFQLDSASDALSELSGQMAGSTREASHRSDNVAAATEQMSTNMSSVAASMEETSTNIEMVASASEQMTATINEIAQNSENARRISQSAVEQSTETTQQVDALGQAALEIGQITETINEISEQTNLLALNATIEAARAGEAGKGFAVVANEIKELARQTALSTSQIREQISRIQSTTKKTVAQIGDVSGVIHQVDDIVSNIAGAIEEQSATTKEIANNIAQAARGILEVNKNVSQSSVVSEQISKEISGLNSGVTTISSMGEQLNASANSLSELASRLQDAVQRFKI